MPQVGFLPPDDPRVLGTIAAIERELMRGRLRAALFARGDPTDGDPARKVRFSPAASGWRTPTCFAGASTTPGLFSIALWHLSNDLGLLAEEYDPLENRLLGNFPQGFSHIGLVNTAYNLCKAAGPAEQRAARAAPATADT